MVGNKFEVQNSLRCSMRAQKNMPGTDENTTTTDKYTWYTILNITPGVVAVSCVYFVGLRAHAINHHTQQYFFFGAVVDAVQQ